MPSEHPLREVGSESLCWKVVPSELEPSPLGLFLWLLHVVLGSGNVGRQKNVVVKLRLAVTLPLGSGEILGK